MGSFSKFPGKITPANVMSGSADAVLPRPTVRMIIGDEDREITSLDEARSFLEECDAGGLADLLLADLDEMRAPQALVAFRHRLERMRLAL